MTRQVDLGESSSSCTFLLLEFKLKMNRLWSRLARGCRGVTLSCSHSLVTAYMHPRRHHTQHGHRLLPTQAPAIIPPARFILCHSQLFFKSRYASFFWTFLASASNSRRLNFSDSERMMKTADLQGTTRRTGASRDPNHLKWKYLRITCIHLIYSNQLTPYGNPTISCLQPSTTACPFLL